MFVDIYPPDCMRVIEKPVYCIPRWNVTINSDAGGHETRIKNWNHPLWSFQLPEAIRQQSHFEPILAFWLGLGGPKNTFPWPNPVDLASRGLANPNIAPAITRSDQFVAVADGAKDSFQLLKKYE